MPLTPEHLANAVAHARAGHMDRAVAIAPAHEIENALGTDLAKAGDSAGAERHYRRAIELDPSFFKPKNNLGNLLRQRDPWAAVDAYRSALALEPTAHKVHGNLGRVFVDLGLWVDAADCFQRAFDHGAGPDALLMRGIALESMGDNERAMAAYVRAAELGDAGGASRRDQLSSALARFGSFGRAVPDPSAGATPAGRRRVVDAPGDELAALLAPLTAEVFVQRYWAKEPLFVKGFAKKYEGLFSGAAFIEAVGKPGAPNTLRASFDKQVRKGPRLPPAPGEPTTTLFPIAADIAGSLYDAGATLCMSEVDTRVPHLASFVAAIRRQLGYPGKVAFNAYASGPGAGFNWHFDGRIASTLQIEGTKRWRFSRRPALPWPRGNGIHNADGSASYGDKAIARSAWEKLEPLDEKEAIAVILEPGDFLVLPAGCWHDASAGAGGSLALNLAFLPFSHTHIVEEILDGSLVHDAAWRSPTPLFRPDAGAPGEVDEAARKALSAQLLRAADTLRDAANDPRVLAEVWASFVQGTGPAVATRLLPEPIAPSDRLRARRDLYLRVVGDELVVFTGRGAPVELGGVGRSILERALTGGPFSAENAAPDRPWREVSDLLRELVARGVLERA